MNVQIPVKWLQELLALCGPEDHELRERVMVSITAMDEQAARAVVLPEPVAVQIRHIKEERWRTFAVVLYDLFAGDEYERRYIYTEQQVRDLLAEAACTKSQTTAQEPFGYFKAEPFGWCGLRRNRRRGDSSL